MYITAIILPLIDSFSTSPAPVLERSALLLVLSSTMAFFFLGSLLLHLITFKPTQDNIDSIAEVHEDIIGIEKKSASLLPVVVDSGRSQGFSVKEESKENVSDIVSARFLLSCSLMCLGLSLALFMMKSGELSFAFSSFQFPQIAQFGR